MKNLLTCLGLMVALAATGCTLYFGPSDGSGGGGTYSYCDQTGCYVCDNNTGNCTPQSGCRSDQDCAAGCYCDTQTGSCVETGFCSYDSDCPQGEHCDARATCVPDNQNNQCWNTGCPMGQYCDQTTGACTPSTTCNTQADCNSGSACVNGTCTPVCVAGCYYDPSTGGCVETGYCTTDSDCAQFPGDICDTGRSTCIPNPNPPPPACSTLTTEADCTARQDCVPIYGGVNCHNPNNPTQSCTQPGSNCVCDSYYFAACADAAAPPPAP